MVPRKFRPQKSKINHQKQLILLLLYSFCFLCRSYADEVLEKEVDDLEVNIDLEQDAKVEMAMEVPEVESLEVEPEVAEVPEPEVESETKTEPESEPETEPEAPRPKWNKHQNYNFEELEALYDHENGLTSNPPGLVNAYAWELLLSGNNKKQNAAYKMFKYLANDYGLPSAQHALAFMYMNGIGLVDVSDLVDSEGNEKKVEQPSKISQAQYLSKGITYQTFASLGNDELAQQTLAYQYLTGHGMKKDCEKALIYYEKSAKAIFDREKANVLYTLSNRHKDVLSKYQIQISEYEDPTVETNVEIDDASQALERISFQEMKAVNDPEELLQVGQYYLNGLFGITRNLVKAENAFSRIPKDNKAYAMAQAFLGKIYIDGGDGVEADYDRARHHLDIAVRAGVSGLASHFLKIPILKLSQQTLDLFFFHNTAPPSPKHTTAYSTSTAGASQKTLTKPELYSKNLPKPVGTMPLYT